MRHRTRGHLPAIAMLSAISGIANLSASGLLATSVEAADLGPYNGRQQWRAPQSAFYPPALRWNGFYGGIQAGYGWSDTDARSTTIGTGATEAFNYSSSGALGGLHAGYNWQVNNFVFGLETDLEASGIKNTGLSSTGSAHTTSIDWMGSLRGRFGLAVASNTLLYVTGGLAYGGISTERSAGLAFKPFAGNDVWKTGWTLGAGVEHAFTSSISARLEYRYTDFGSLGYTSPGANLIDTSSISNNAIRAGLSFKF